MIYIKSIRKFYASFYLINWLFFCMVLKFQAFTNSDFICFRELDVDFKQDTEIKALQISTTEYQTFLIPRAHQITIFNVTSSLSFLRLCLSPVYIIKKHFLSLSYAQLQKCTLLQVNAMLKELPEEEFGPGIDIREYSILDNPILPSEVNKFHFHLHLKL